MSQDIGLMKVKFEGNPDFKEIYTTDVHITKQTYLALQNPSTIDIRYGTELLDGTHSLNVVLPGPSEGVRLLYIGTDGSHYDAEGTLTVTVSKQQIAQEGHFNVSFSDKTGKDIQMEGTFEGRRSI
jgi:hypothetical protein